MIAYMYMSIDANSKENLKDKKSLNSILKI